MKNMEITCLLKNTKAAELVKAFVKVKVGERLAANNSAKVEEIYEDVRGGGIEIDKSTLGFIYNSVYSGFSEKKLSTSTEVDEFAGEDFAKAMESVRQIIYDKGGASQVIGSLSPEKDAVSQLAKAFAQTMSNASGKVKSAMVQMVDMVVKAANNNRTSKDNVINDFTKSLQDFFGLENGIGTLDGQVNNLETLHTKLKEEISHMVDAYTLQHPDLPQSEIDTFRQKWEQHTRDFMNSAYGIFLNLRDKNSLIVESLKQIKINGVEFIDANGNIRWSTLTKHNNPTEIKTEIKKLFKTGFTNKSGVTIKFTPQQAARIADYFETEYIARLNNARGRAMKVIVAKQNSAQSVLAKFVTDSGFFNILRDKDGKLLLSKTDWVGFIKDVKSKVGNRQLQMDYVIDKLKDYLTKTQPQLTQFQVNRIITEMENKMLVKLDEKALDKVNNINKLVALLSINNGIAFNEETQHTIGKVIGLSDVTQEVLDEIKQIAEAAKKIQDNPNLEYSFSAIAALTARMSEILHTHQFNSSLGMKAIDVVSGLFSANTMSLVLNPGNMVENVSTQIGTSAIKSMQLLITNPKIFFKSFGEISKAGFASFLNYINSGASVSLPSENNNTPDMAKLTNLKETWRKGGAGKGRVALDSLKYIVGITLRTTMNSFDNATSTSLLRQNLIANAVTFMKENGLSNSEITQRLSKMFDISKKDMKQIESDNLAVMGAIKAAGVRVTSTLAQVNKRDLMIRRYEDALMGIGNLSPKDIKEYTKILVEASFLNAKTLGGKRRSMAEDVITKRIFAGADAATYIERHLRSRANRKFSEDGEGGFSYFAANMVNAIFSKFVNTVANFVVLGISATPLGAFSANSLRKKRNDLKTKHSIDIANLGSTDPQIVKEYIMLNQQMRDYTARMVVGTLAIIAYLVSKVNDDDDDEPYKIVNDEYVFDKEGRAIRNENAAWDSKLYETNSGRRLIQKILPMGIAFTIGIYQGYKKGNNGGSNKVAKNTVENALELYTIYSGVDYDKENQIIKWLKSANKSGDYNEFAGAVLRETTPTLNIDQARSAQRFYSTLQSAFNAGKIYDVKEMEEKRRIMYKEAEGFIDNVFLTGATSTLKYYLYSK